jgi:hypothetical protein
MKDDKNANNSYSIMGKYEVDYENGTAAGRAGKSCICKPFPKKRFIVERGMTPLRRYSPFRS